MVAPSFSQLSLRTVSAALSASLLLVGCNMKPAPESPPPGRVLPAQRPEPRHPGAVRSALHPRGIEIG